jgi:trans-aconitate 2-methyltransferase
MRAASDLLARIPDEGQRRIADVRAGPWSTRPLLAKRFSGADIVPMDPSRMHGRPPADAAKEFDLVFSSADLGLSTGLRRMLPKLAQRLATDGHLAVQFPNNLYEPNRALLRMVAAEGPWAKTLLPVAKTQPFNQTIEGLYALLRPICASVDIWETTYLCALDGVEAIVDFMKASGLAPFLDPLDSSAQRKFLDRYAAELARAYPEQPDGAVLMRFPRIFVLAKR